ncbi:MAG: RHS repeat protein, partial [Akkermansiaceae bacterium]|nr:RHS repeat protein [Akkermansiaceae bacterium]
SRGTLEVAGDSSVVWHPDHSFLGPGTLLDGFLEVLDPTVFRYTSDDGTSYLIDEKEGLLSLADPNGNALTISSDGMFHSSGERVLFTRDSAGRITRLTDPAGNELVYTYDPRGRLVTFVNRVGDLTRFFYENPAFPFHLTRIEDPRGINAVRTEFDHDGRMIRQIDAAGNSIRFNHDIANHTETIVDRLGNPTIHHYDDFGNVTRTIDALGGETVRTYDQRDNELTTTTPEGLTTTRTFGEGDGLLTEEDGEGNTIAFTYDDHGRPLVVRDPNGHASLMAYDSSGNLLSLAGPLSSLTTFTYQADGNLATLTDGEGSTTSYHYDDRGRQVGMDVAGRDGTVLRSETYTYDPNGNRDSLTTIRILPDGATQVLLTMFDHDAENRLVRTVFPDGTETRTEYNSLGQQS